MTMNHVTLSHYLNDLLEVQRFDDVAYNGLQFEGTRPIKKMIGAVTASLAVLEEAADLQADCLLVHHGLFLKGLVHEIHGTLRKKIDLLCRSGIHLFAYHLPLDAHVEFGNAWPVARKLNWTNLEPFGTYKETSIGVQGTCAEQSVEALHASLQKIWKSAGVVVKASDKPVTKAALITGSGHRFFQEAITAGVDCFITGTADEPMWHMAREEKVHYLSFGHAATETTGVELLGKHLAEKFGLEFQFLPEKNPF